MTDKKTKKQPKQYTNKNPLEAFKDMGGGVVNAVKNDIGKNMAKGLWEQFLGAGKYSPKKENSREKRRGDLQEGEELVLAQAEREEKAVRWDIEAGIDYRRQILKGTEVIAAENTREIQVKIQEAMIELRRLVQTSKDLEAQIKHVSVTEAPVDPGKYHLNFFEWLVSTIREARLRIEDSASWLSTFQSKKSKKQYWNMFKKHGTTFGLSNERVVATQTG